MDVFDDLIPIVVQTTTRLDQVESARSGRDQVWAALGPGPGETALGPGPEENAIPAPKPYRDSAGRYLPGSSGGPGRRPSLASLIRHFSGDGYELVAYAFGVLRGEITQTLTSVNRMTGEIYTEEVPFPPGARNQVMEFLADRGFGKEVDRIEMSGPDGKPIQTETAEAVPDLSKLTTEEVRQYLALRMKAMAASKVIESTARVVEP